MGPEALLPLVYAWGGSPTPCFAKGWGPHAYPFCKDFEKGCVFFVKDYAPVLFILQFAATDLGGPSLFILNLRLFH